MASPEERQVARLADAPDFAALKVYLEREEEEELEKLARKTYAMPDEHDKVEWQKFKARWDGVRHVFKTVETARRSVAQAETKGTA